LAYYSLVNSKGEILERGSFNEINGQNYHDKLEALSQNRDEARKSWQTI
jgi:CRISPR-associated protein Cpf1